MLAKSQKEAIHYNIFNNICCYTFYSCLVLKKENGQA